MLWVNVFNARLNAFCRYIILRLFHNIFLPFLFASSFERLACLQSSSEWNCLRWDWKHSDHMKPETVISHRLASKLNPFHSIMHMCSYFPFCVCVCDVAYSMCHSLFLFTFSHFWCEKMAFSLRHSAQHRMSVLCLNALLYMPFCCHRAETKAFKLLHTTHIHPILNPLLGFHTVTSSSFFYCLIVLISECIYTFLLLTLLHFIKMSVFRLISIWYRLNAHARIHTRGEGKNDEGK